MKILHILRSRPKITVEQLIEGSNNGDQPKSTSLYEYQNEDDWLKLVDDIFEHDKVISWW